MRSPFDVFGAEEISGRARSFEVPNVSQQTQGLALWGIGDRATTMCESIVRGVEILISSLLLRQEAMLLPCCKKSACRSCAERGLMRSRKNGKFTCNQCGSDRYAIKDLAPNYALREVIDELTRRKAPAQVLRNVPNCGLVTVCVCARTPCAW